MENHESITTIKELVAEYKIAKKRKALFYPTSEPKLKLVQVDIDSYIPEKTVRRIIKNFPRDYVIGFESGFMAISDTAGTRSGYLFRLVTRAEVEAYTHTHRVLRG